MTRSTRLVMLAVAGVAVAGLLGAVLFGGYLVARWNLFPATLFAKVERRILLPLFGNPGPTLLKDQVYTTELNRLRAEVGIVPTGRDPSLGPLEANGGALTSFGKDVLLLAYSGHVFASTGAKVIRDSGLRAPDNNRQAFMDAVVSPELGFYKAGMRQLRYNDLKYFRTKAAHGLIVSYSEYHPDRKCITNTLARLDFPPAASSIDEMVASPNEWRVVFRTQPCLKFGETFFELIGASGRIAISPNGMIYLASGDFNINGLNVTQAPIAQDEFAQYGKIIAVDLDGLHPRTVSMGHRNILGVGLTTDGRLFATENGMRGGDELNLIREGANYGWPLESYGTTYNRTRIPNALSFGRHNDFEQPVISWVPSIAPTAVIEATGFHPAWSGDLLVGSLRDQSLRRVRFEGGKVIYDERIEIGTRVRDLHLHNDGRLVIWSDNQELIFLTAAQLYDINERLAKFISQRSLDEQASGALRAAMDKCAQCHSFLVDDHDRAPSLAKIYESGIAKTTYRTYSQGLADIGGTWTREALDSFISDPARFARETTMPDPQIDAPATRQLLIDFLKELKDDE